ESPFRLQKGANANEQTVSVRECARPRFSTRNCCPRRSDTHCISRWRISLLVAYLGHDKMRGKGLKLAFIRLAMLWTPRVRRHRTRQRAREAVQQRSPGPD